MSDASISETREGHVLTERNRIVRNGSWYLCAQLVPSLLRLAVLPLMTRLLTPSAYGLVALWTTILTFAGVGVRWTDDVLLRFLPGTEAEARPRTVWSWSTLAAWSGGAITASFLGVAAVTRDTTWLLLALVCGLEAVENSLLQFARAVQRARAYAFATLLSSVGTTLLALAIIKHLGPQGVLWGWVGADVGAIVLLWATVGGEVHQTTRYAARDRELRRSMFRYGAPFVVATGSWTLLALLDRFFVSAFSGSRELGLYSLAYSLVNAVLLGLFMVLGFSSYANVVATFETEGPGAATALLRETIALYHRLAIPATVTISFFCYDALRLLVPSTYVEAGRCIPLLAAGLFVQGLLPFSTKAFIMTRRSSLQASSALTGLATNIALNFALIPRFGAVGAAGATVASYTLTVVAVDGLARRTPVRVPLCLGLASRLTAASVVIVGACRVFSSALTPTERVLGVAPVALVLVLGLSFAAEVRSRVRAFHNVPSA